MNIEKLQLALSDLMKQRDEMTAELDDAIATVQSLIARLSGPKAAGSDDKQASARKEPGYLDQTIQFLESTGKPAHITVIVKHIQTIRNDAKRASIEAALSRHIAAKGAAARLIKLGPGLYGTPQQAQKTFPLGAAVPIVN